MVADSTTTTFKTLELIGPGFWNIRGTWRYAAGLINIGTHMSIIELQNGKFLIVDALDLTPQIKAEIDELTNKGTNIEAVLATHPFHTMALTPFYKAYPNVPYFGTPRHLLKLPGIPWAGDLADATHRNKWSPEVQMRIPSGPEFTYPTPEKLNHLNSVFVFHARSRTIHEDDTIMIGSNPSVLLRVAGFKDGSFSFQPSIKGPGLQGSPQAPYAFRDSLLAMIRDWDFDNICAAHMGNCVGGAKGKLLELVERSAPFFKKISERNAKNGGKRPTEAPNTVLNEETECG